MSNYCTSNFADGEIWFDPCQNTTYTRQIVRNLKCCVERQVTAGKIHSLIESQLRQTVIGIKEKEKNLNFLNSKKILYNFFLKLNFQISTNLQTSAQRAVNVNVTRETVRATVESIKGEVCSAIFCL